MVNIVKIGYYTENHALGICKCCRNSYGVSISKIDKNIFLFSLGCFNGIEIINNKKELTNYIKQYYPEIETNQDQDLLLYFLEPHYKINSTKYPLRIDNINKIIDNGKRVEKIKECPQLNNCKGDGECSYLKDIDRNKEIIYIMNKMKNLWREGYNILFNYQDNSSVNCKEILKRIVELNNNFKLLAKIDIVGKSIIIHTWGFNEERSQGNTIFSIYPKIEDAVNIILES